MANPEAPRLPDVCSSLTLCSLPSDPSHHRYCPVEFSDDHCPPATPPSLLKPHLPRGSLNLPFASRESALWLTPSQPALNLHLTQPFILNVLPDPMMPLSRDLLQPHCQQLYCPLLEKAPMVPNGAIIVLFQTPAEPSLQLDRHPVSFSFVSNP